MSTRHPNTARLARQRGITTMELAMLLPILVTLLLGLIEVANVLRVQLTLNNAAQVAARQVAVDPTVRTAAAATTFLAQQNLLPMVTQTNAGATAPVLSLTPENPTCSLSETCTPFEVKLTYTYHAVVTPFMDSVFNGIVLAAAVQKTAEPGTGSSLTTQ